MAFNTSRSDYTSVSGHSTTIRSAVKTHRFMAVFSFHRSPAIVRIANLIKIVLQIQLENVPFLRVISARKHREVGTSDTE